MLIDDQEVRYILQLAQRDCIHIFHLGEIIIGIGFKLAVPLEEATDNHYLVSLYQMSVIEMLLFLQLSPSLEVPCLKYVNLVFMKVTTFSYIVERALGTCWEVQLETRSLQLSLTL